LEIYAFRATTVTMGTLEYQPWVKYFSKILRSFFKITFASSTVFALPIRINTLPQKNTNLIISEIRLIIDISYLVVWPRKTQESTGRIDNIVATCSRQVIPLRASTAGVLTFAVISCKYPFNCCKYLSKCLTCYTKLTSY
jgi:hypothetical protein